MAKFQSCLCLQYCIEILLFCRIHLKQSLPRLTLYDWRLPTSPCWGRFSTASSSQLSTSSRAFEGSWELRAAFSGTRPTWPRGLPGSTGTTWASPWQGAPSLGEEGACQVRSNFESQTIFLHHINKTLHYDCFSDHNTSSQRSVMFISNILSRKKIFAFAVLEYHWIKIWIELICLFWLQ